jgi:gamma-glutamyltranspeptidase/glutathione hydrolase
VDPLGVDFQGYTLWEIPPNGQGIAALQMLQILKGFDLRTMGHNSPEYLHHLIEAKKVAYEDRGRYYADPEFADVPAEILISEQYGAARRALIDPARANDYVDPGDPRAGLGGTIYLAVADSAGNMVSLIQSNYSGFGSGFVPPGLGFALQNRGCGFSLEDDHPNAYAPGKRPFHTIIPAFVTREGRPYMAFGVMGGDVQPQGQIQVLLNHLVFGMDVQEAGDAARFRHSHSTEPGGLRRVMRDGGCVSLESEIGPDIRDALAARGHRICQDGWIHYGGYQAVRWDAENGVYWGASESRVDGQAAGW